MTERVMIVTGGARGIGAATCRAAAAAGYAVCVNYVRNRAAADAVVADVVKAGARAIAVQADVAVEADVLRLFGETDRALGRVDVLVNNAGILTRAARLETMEVSRLQHVFATNVISAMVCAREAVRRMSRSAGGAGGAIVNVSTGFVKSGAPGYCVDYAATKAAIEVFSLGLSREVAAEGIRVNCVRPGLIDTEIHADGGDATRPAKAKDYVPLKRPGDPVEVARAILWLASEQASYTIGTVLDVTGGL